MFLDETGMNVALTRRYGWARRGQRVFGHVPQNWGDNVTLVSALGLRGMVAPYLIFGSMTGAVFDTYVREHLAQQLRPGDVLVLDNLSAHHGETVPKALHEVGASVLYLPPYSPDLNPIELAWNKLKAEVRRCAARCVDSLVNAVAQALRNISEQDAHAWFHHAGYHTHVNCNPY